MVEGIGLADTTGDRRADSEFERLLGIVAWREGRIGEARTHAEAALTVARRQDAATLEHRSRQLLAALDAGDVAGTG